MPNGFFGDGNVGSSPEQKMVQVGNEKRKVTEIRVMFDRYKPDGQGGFTQLDGLWSTVAIWGDRGDHVMKHISTGARVHVVGEIVPNNYEDKDGGKHEGFQVVATGIYLGLARLESVTYRPKAEKAGGDFEGDIPQ